MSQLHVAEILQTVESYSNSTPVLIGSFGFSLSAKNSLGAVDQSPIAWQLLKGCWIHKKLGLHSAMPDVTPQVFITN
jgi:hypothetical protein